MDVHAHGPLRVGSVLWQSPRGGWVLTVVAKATFDLVPGDARLAERQDDVTRGDRPFDDDARPSGASPDPLGARSVYAPSDLAPFKPHTDVMLVGHAFAPGEEPARSIAARLRVGDLDKTVEVTADRALTLDGEVREGARFTKMPLRYERAAGGPDTWNPVGTRPDAVDAFGRATLPNLQPVGAQAGPRADPIPPIGFGPVSEAWWSRRERLGRHAKTWSPEDFVERPLPDDIDPGYFNAAPRDQQLAALRDDATLTLENLHPTIPALVTRLPGLRPRAFLVVARGHSDVRMAPDTLWIDTDRAVATVTWRGQVLLEGPHQAGAVHVALEHASRPVTWAELAAPASAAPQSIGQSPFAASILTMSPDPAVAPTEAAPTFGRGPHVTPMTAEVMTLAAAVSSGRAPAWLALHGGAPPSSAGPTSSERLDMTMNSPIRRGTQPIDPAVLVAVREAEAPASSKRVALELLGFDERVVDRFFGANAAADRTAAVRRALVSTAAVDAEGLERAYRLAFASDGGFEAPIARVDGALEFAIDPLDELSVLAAAAAPFAATEVELADLCRAAAGATSTTPRLVIATFRDRIRAALARAAKGPLAEGLDLAIATSLAEGRRWAKRSVFGEGMTSAKLHAAGASEPVVVYLPETLVAWLPLGRGTQVAAFVTVHPRQDPNETHALALRAIAVARRLEID